MKKLDGLNCILTGASRGLGETIARVFWREGANLLLVARSKDALRRLAGSLPVCAGQKVGICAADLSEKKAASKVLTAARKYFDRLDVLVNDAAMGGPMGPVWKADWEAWLETWQVNFLSAADLCRRAVTWMAQGSRGKIINLSGGGAASSRPNFSAYASSKAALVRFSEVLADEVAPVGIDVNCVAPGPMRTAMVAGILKAGPEQAGEQEYSKAARINLEGGASPERAAELCVFLASAASDGITGKLISAVWDPWEVLEQHKDDLKKTEVYTLRRIVPNDRGLRWADKT